MKEVKVRFLRNRELDHINVTVEASERDATVTKLMEQLTGESADVLNVVSTDGELLKLYTDDLVSVSVRDKLTLLVTEDGMYTVRQSLQSIESALEGGNFLRISRHELINVDKIEKCNLKVKGELKLELAGFAPVVRTINAANGADLTETVNMESVLGRIDRKSVV